MVRIEVPISMVDKDRWMGVTQAIFYAIDKDTFTICYAPYSLWEKKATKRVLSPVVIENGALCIDIPEDFYNRYFTAGKVQPKIFTAYHKKDDFEPLIVAWA